MVLAPGGVSGGDHACGKMSEFCRKDIPAAARDETIARRDASLDKHSGNRHLLLTFR
jgi:hypothetical protein